MNHKIFFHIKFLPKIGPIFAKSFEKLIGGDRFIDFLYHFPNRIAKKKLFPKLYEIEDKEDVILEVEIEKYIPPSSQKSPFKIQAFTSSGYVNLIFFKIFPNFIEKNFPIGEKIIISGKIDIFNGIQISHPNIIKNDKDNISNNVPIYPLTERISQKILSDKIEFVLNIIPDFPEWIDNGTINQNGWKSWKKSIIALHNPKSEQELFDPYNIYRRRLSYDELLASKIANLILKQKISENKGIKNEGDGILYNKLLKNLPFSLTNGQKNVLNEIGSDMRQEKQMLRLLQGDVGSGKTIIALLSALIPIENKRQVAFIVPISLLANQHFANIGKFTKDLGIKISILTSKTTKKQKEKLISELKSGEIDLLIGTHAMIYDDIIFKDLGFVIIDEQHRFGVMQRVKLSNKGKNPDILLMSATPIPRSLMMTIYGDMDISILNEKPKGRIEIDTRIISAKKVDTVYDGVKRAIQNGEKIYWVCALIDENEELEMISANEKLKELCAVFGEDKIEFIHGRMKEKEKEEKMNNFMNKDSDVKILLATTVIEVGVDISDATIIIIENAENFGLSQLHQLRGRVGRGNKKSFAVLLYGKKFSANARKRLAIMKKSNDGFFIAEEDLKIRGFGELAGTRQSGLPEYKIANLDFDYDILEIANQNAKILFENQDKNIELLLKIFNREEIYKL